MTYDDVIVTIGGFGRYQCKIYLLVCLSLIPCGFHVMAGVFLAAETDFRCLQSHESSENATYQLSLNLTNSSYQWYNESDDWSQCERYDDDNPTDQSHDSDGNLSSTSPTVKCDSFVYDKSIYALTTTTEFSLICDKAWLRSVTESLFTVGIMLGATIFGGLADAYGRKPIFYLSIFIQAISGLLVAASPEIISYIIFRLIVGLTVSGMHLTGYVIAFEMAVPKKRLMVAIGLELFYTSGYILLTGFAYFLTNWRYLQVAITVPTIACLVYWWFIPESTRWLVSTGRLEKAKDSLLNMSLTNGVKLSKDTLDNMLSNCSVNEGDSGTIFDLLRYPNLRQKSLVLFFIWFANNSTYYGISWSTSSLVGDDYINFAISGLVEVPALLFVFLTLDRWGRRNILCTSMLLAGTSLVLRVFVPDHISWLEVVLTMIGKLAITASLMTLSIFTAELFPTVIRNVGIGAAFTCGMIGAIISSYVNYSAVVWKPLPVLIFGSGALIAGLTALLLPETLNEKLPESIEDGEQFGKMRANPSK